MYFISSKKIKIISLSIFLTICFSSFSFGAPPCPTPPCGGPPENDPVFNAWLAAFIPFTNADETDQVFTASPANGITSSNIINWDSAFGWGDHSTAGYLTSFIETDPILGNSIESSEITDGTITTEDIGNGEVQTADIRNNAVTGDKVADQSLTADDIADGAGSGLDADMVDGMHALDIINSVGFWQTDNGSDIYYNDGNVGIGTIEPQTALDINGAMKLKLQTSEPFACDAAHDGSIALTGEYRLCVCKNGTGWVSRLMGIHPVDLQVTLVL